MFFGDKPDNEIANFKHGDAAGLLRSFADRSDLALGYGKRPVQSFISAATFAVISA